MAIVLALAVNLVIYAIGRAAGGAFTYTQSGRTSTVDAVAITFLSTGPLTVGLTLVAILSRRWPVLINAAKIASPALALATIALMRTPCRRSSRGASSGGAGVATQRRRSFSQGSCRGRCSNGAQDKAMGFLAQELSGGRRGCGLVARGFDCPCRPGWVGDLHPVLAPQGFQGGAIKGMR
jgi:hypothetical protein